MAKSNFNNLVDKNNSNIINSKIIFKICIFIFLFCCLLIAGCTSCSKQIDSVTNKDTNGNDGGIDGFDSGEGLSQGKPVNIPGYSTDQVIEKLINTNLNLNSYTLNMTTILKTTGNIEGEPIESQNIMIESGAYDRINKKMYSRSNVETFQDNQKFTINTQTYIIDGQIYTFTLDKWNIKKFDSESTWISNDEIAKQIDLLKTASLSQLPDDESDGKKYYILMVYPDLKEIVNYVLGEQKQANLEKLNYDFEDIIKSYSVKFWVDADTFVIEKYKTTVELKMNPENMGIAGAKDGEILINMDSFIKVSGINEPVSFDLPNTSDNGLMS